MRYLIPLIVAITLLAISCIGTKEIDDTEMTSYSESKLNFFDPSKARYAYFDSDNYLFKEWIRNSSNLKTVHETVKKMGYKQFISPRNLYDNPCMLWGYVKRPLNHIIDSLIVTYRLDTIETTYYREFWQRRKSEQNDSMVFVVLNDLDSIFLQLEETIQYDTNWVNDTLVRLITIDKFTFEPTKGQAMDDFNYLVNIGLHQSAYNLLFERFQYSNVDWNKDSLLQSLSVDTGKCCPTAWLFDNEK
jgi:hypothetical protein